jgi:uncharacterized protein
MEMSGSRQINASQTTVWQKLNDPEVLRRCIPGCESLEKIDDTNMKGVVALKLGPMSLRFNGDVQLTNLNPPESYRLTGSGKAGPAGFASGFADVMLVPKDGGTELSYKVESTVGGRMAQLGARLIDAAAASLAGEFFDKFAAEVAPAAPLTADGTNGAGPSRGTAPATNAMSKPGAAMPSWVWWIVVAAILAALYYFFQSLGLARH